MSTFRWGKLMLIGVVALIVIGAEGVARCVRMVGQLDGEDSQHGGEFKQVPGSDARSEMSDRRSGR